MQVEINCIRIGTHGNLFNSDFHAIRPNCLYAIFSPSFLSLDCIIINYHFWRCDTVESAVRI